MHVVLVLLRATSASFADSVGFMESTSAREDNLCEKESYQMIHLIRLHPQKPSIRYQLRPNSLGQTCAPAESSDFHPRTCYRRSVAEPAARSSSLIYGASKLHPGSLLSCSLSCPPAAIMGKNLFSVPIFFIVFRETLEAAIIVSVLLGLAEQIVHDDPPSTQSTIVRTEISEKTSNEGGSSTDAAEQTLDDQVQRRRLIRKLRFQVCF